MKKEKSNKMVMNKIKTFVKIIRKGQLSIGKNTIKNGKIDKYKNTLHVFK